MVKAIVQDLIISTLGLWLDEWFVPREDYDWIRERSWNIEDRAEQDRANHERLIEQRADDMIKIEDLGKQARGGAEIAQHLALEMKWYYDNYPMAWDGGERFRKAMELHQQFVKEGRA